MCCPNLLQLKKLPFACLMKSALQLFGTVELQAFYEINSHLSTSTMICQLAEVIYYRQGSNLAAQKEWNSMTRLQLEHELRSLGLIDNDEVLTDWQLRLRLAGAVFAKEREEVEQGPWLAHYEESSNEADESEREVSSKGKGSRKIIYTKNKGQNMVF